MIVRAKLNNYRMSARKVRLVADLVRGKKVDEAITLLSFTNKKAASAIIKLIKSAIANAKNNYNLSETELFIQEIKVDEGITYKRWMPRAMGRATPIRKRGSNVSLSLGVLEGSGKKGEENKSKTKKVDSKKKVASKKADKKTKTTKKSKEDKKGKAKKKVVKKATKTKKVKSKNKADNK